MVQHIFKDGVKRVTFWPTHACTISYQDLLNIFSITFNKPLDMRVISTTSNDEWNSFNVTKKRYVF